ncbi:MAG: Adenylosuccinate lyase [Leptospirillum sp. Group II 'C75']|jgi:adenylosuccinate lyase|uniref:adenylosuccinate lyase n=1 Tax=Leptospirillum sp. Group II 'CF-1' TaxID=1660083 RepID=UPI0000F0CCDA|nr:adenylosuccinate lyase [Leptospirillum sp. Group II 'CF-1']AKS23544.1 adenylosuccinate lyase [Leptospirillum sp. Group II 'CF-1']EAY56298.1 MAG: Adenylosuccinate lyase [Leptospirillum rubarum]EIJ76977.1 MAG: Adenylosuccinate lyase [Leptospirillum sp. Group II 'C75']
MIERYTRKDMGALFETEHRLRIWLEVEKAATRALMEKGVVDPEAARLFLDSSPEIRVRRMEEIERETRHDVIAFLTMISEQIPAPSRSILHFGMTSQDLVDTAQSLFLLEAIDLLQRGMDRFSGILREQALRHRGTLTVGRSHGVHGEPIVFGVKFLSWYSEFGRHKERLRHARETMRVGKMSGAMGTAVHIDPATEEMILFSLGLKPEEMATQVVARDRHAELLSTLALIGASLERIAVEIRHLQRTEVREVEEPFAPGQKGSSAMPHKRNPVGAENITGLARLLRSYAQAAYEDVALWHERDISHSSVERVVLPDSCILLDYMLHRMGDILKDLIVYPEQMQRNLDLTGGLVYSQAVLLALVRTGLPRETAYRIVQDAAMRTWKGEGHLRDTLRTHPDLPENADPRLWESAFSPEPFMKNIDALYERVLGPEAGA